MAVMLVFGPILLIVLPSTTEACFEFTSAIPNPCIEKECPFGADCIPSFDGRSAECVCPVKCPTFGDSRGSRPICGGGTYRYLGCLQFINLHFSKFLDGKNYPNLCELNHQACRIGRTVSVRYNGSCGKETLIKWLPSLANWSLPPNRSLLWCQMSRLADLSNRR